jgi:hypothetical protein
MNDPGKNPYAPPQQGYAPVSPSTVETGIVERQALQLAGVFLLAGAALNAIALLKFNTTLVRMTYSSRWFSVGFDVYIGGSLLAGRYGKRWWAMVRAILGAMLVGFPALVRGATADGALVVASCAAIALLVAPKPTPRRVTAAAVLYGVTFLVMLVVFARAAMTMRHT